MIGSDEKWDDPTSRLIYIDWAAYGSVIHPDPVIEALVERDPDLAQVYLDPFPVTPLSFANPVSLATTSVLYVASWPRSERKAHVQIAAISRNGSLLELTGAYDPSDSGSPVLNSQGELIAMLIERSVQTDGSTTGLALPLYVALFVPAAPSSTFPPLPPPPGLFPQRPNTLPPFAGANPYAYPSRDGIPNIPRPYATNPFTNPYTNALPSTVPQNYARPSYLQVYENRLASYYRSPVGKIPLPNRDDIDFSSLSNRCVFIGRKSAFSTHKPEDMPFGLDVLQAVVAPGSRSQRDKEIVRTKTSARSNCPIIIEGSAYYGRVLAELLPGDEIYFRDVIVMNYDNDLFYWATIDHAVKSR